MIQCFYFFLIFYPTKFSIIIYYDYFHLNFYLNLMHFPLFYLINFAYLYFFCYCHPKGTSGNKEKAEENLFWALDDSRVFYRFCISGVFVKTHQLLSSRDDCARFLGDGFFEVFQGAKNASLAFFGESGEGGKLFFGIFVQSVGTCIVFDFLWSEKTEL